MLDIKTLENDISKEREKSKSGVVNKVKKLLAPKKKSQNHTNVSISIEPANQIKPREQEKNGIIYCRLCERPFPFEEFEDHESQCIQFTTGIACFKKQFVKKKFFFPIFQFIKKDLTNLLLL